MRNIGVAIAAAVIAFLAVAILQENTAPNFDYAAASPAEKQQYLENVATGFIHGFLRGAGDAAELESVIVLGEVDLIAIDIQMTDDFLETAPKSEIAAFRANLKSGVCRLMKKQHLLAHGVAVELTIDGSAGGAVAELELHEKSCAAGSA